ncbi:hypothetical protein H109_04512 [Trichophyton interdigitale MR816]|uniref:Uncharacterized protein n=2 Tax=Trichophyton TaxID=5550 RepID=A0A059J822_TRIIM|nr:hypothetical protein TEQG_08571 [Trichophyton equinum CBS 127.97]KDB23622.1 hypothetical protein H109_04512 [Trichophyton interdigitale MR816]
MCRYLDAPLIPKRCTQNPKHVVTVRYYEICDNPQPLGTYRHCSNAYASPGSNIVFGSSRAPQYCDTCLNPNNVTIVHYLSPEMAAVVFQS